MIVTHIHQGPHQQDCHLQTVDWWCRWQQLPALGKLCLQLAPRLHPSCRSGCPQPFHQQYWAGRCSIAWTPEPRMCLLRQAVTMCHAPGAAIMHGCTCSLLCDTVMKKAKRLSCLQAHYGGRTASSPVVTSSKICMSDLKCLLYPSASLNPESNTPTMQASRNRIIASRSRTFCSRLMTGCYLLCI